MALRKLNKSEIEALANKVKRNIMEENRIAQDLHLEGVKASLALLQDNILTNLGNMSDLTQEFIDSQIQYNAGLDAGSIEAFLRNRELTNFVYPYEQFEDNWRGTDRIKEAIVLAQIEAEDINGLIEAVTKQFKEA